MKKELFGLTDEHGNKVNIILDRFYNISDVKTLAPVEKEKEPEFKVGDWVRHEGDVYRIEEIEKDGWANGDTPGKGWHMNNLIIATPVEIEKHLKKICDEKYIEKKVRCLVGKKIYLVSNKNIRQVMKKVMTNFG